MKKTFKLTLLLFLVLTIMLPLAACLKNPNPIPENNALTLNGMNAAELYKKFVNDLKNSTAYEIQTVTEYTLLGDRKSTVTKRSGDNFYLLSVLFTTPDQDPTEIFLIDDVAYINHDETMRKCDRDNVDDVWGKDFLKPYMTAITQGVPEKYYAALETAELCLENGIYFFTVSFLLPSVTGGIDVTETVCFDSSGKVTKVVTKYDKGAKTAKTTETSIKYDVPLEIIPPVSAYTEIPRIPKTEDEIYQLYADACTKLQESDYLWSSVSIPGIDYYQYRRHKNNRYVIADVGEEITEQWIVKQTGYVRKNGEALSESPIDDAFMELFNTVEGCFPLTPFPQEELTDLACRYESFDRILSFIKVDESMNSYHYEYKISKDMTRVYVTITHYTDNVKLESYTYQFWVDSNYTVKLPNS